MYRSCIVYVKLKKFYDNYLILKTSIFSVFTPIVSPIFFQTVNPQVIGYD